MFIDPLVSRLRALKMAHSRHLTNCPQRAPKAHQLVNEKGRPGAEKKVGRCRWECPGCAVSQSIPVSEFFTKKTLIQGLHTHAFLLM